MLNLIIATLLLFILEAQAYEKLCPTVRIKDLEDLEFSDTEKRLLCGDPKLHAYSNIPAYESKFFLKGFLQSRGYLNPAFEIEDEILYVRPGARAEVEKISVRAENPRIENEVSTELRHLYNDRVLKTETLNDIETTALRLVRVRGYPCAEVRSEADISTERVTVFFDELKPYKFGEIEREDIEGLRRNAFDRYYPFDSNDLFNEELLELTEKRMTRAQVVQGTYFLKHCTEDSFSLSQGFIVGPPRTIRFGVGATTEIGPYAKFRWSHNRYKDMASQLSANLQASFISQELTLTADSFFWPEKPRQSLLTRFEIDREDYPDYEQLLIRLQPHIKWTRDSEGFHKLYTLGPTYEAGLYESEDNTHERAFSSGVLAGALEWMSHDYELYDIHPESGNVFGFSFDFRHPAFGFDVPLLKLTSTAVHIDKLSNWSRGTLVGAVKLDLGTTVVRHEVALSSLPPTLKFYGGGSEDLRGFYLRTLPQNNGLGALTKALLKTELRRTSLFKEYLEGFIFFDAGYFSPRSFEIDDPLFYSPGLGLRWFSPIGIVQGFVAEGFTTGADTDDLDPLFFIGLGGSF